MDPISAGIAAGANIIGGIMGNSQQRETNRMQQAIAAENRQLQLDFAANAIKWKVNDAKAAGIHPLYALGANTPTYTPVSVPLSSTNHMGAGIAAAGQDISRAINTTRSAGERTDAFSKTVQDLTLQKMGLENQLLSSQIAKLNQTPNPPMPIDQRYLIPGQGQTASGPLVENKPLERTPSAPGIPHQEPGAVTDVGFARTPSGGYMPVPSKDVKERIEDNLVQEVAHMIRNNIMPMIGVKSPPPVALPKDSPGWVYDPIRGYRPGKYVPYTGGLFRY